MCFQEILVSPFHLVIGDLEGRSGGTIAKCFAASSQHSGWDVDGHSRVFAVFTNRNTNLEIAR